MENGSAKNGPTLNIRSLKSLIVRNQKSNRKKRPKASRRGRKNPQPNPGQDSNRRNAMHFANAQQKYPLHVLKAAYAKQYIAALGRMKNKYNLQQQQLQNILMKQQQQAQFNRQYINHLNQPNSRNQVGPHFINNNGLIGSYNMNLNPSVVGQPSPPPFDSSNLVRPNMKPLNSYSGMTNLGSNKNTLPYNMNQLEQSRQLNAMSVAARNLNSSQSKGMNNVSNMAVNPQQMNILKLLTNLKANIPKSQVGYSQQMNSNGNLNIPQKNLTVDPDTLNNTSVSFSPGINVPTYLNPDYDFSPASSKIQYSTGDLPNYHLTSNADIQKQYNNNNKNWNFVPRVTSQQASNSFMSENLKKNSIGSVVNSNNSSVRSYHNPPSISNTQANDYILNYQQQSQSKGIPPSVSVPLSNTTNNLQSGFPEYSVQTAQQYSNSNLSPEISTGLVSRKRSYLGDQQEQINSNKRARVVPESHGLATSLPQSTDSLVKEKKEHRHKLTKRSKKESNNLKKMKFLNKCGLIGLRIEEFLKKTGNSDKIHKVREELNRKHDFTEFPEVKVFHKFLEEILCAETTHLGKEEGQKLSDEAFQILIRACKHFISDVTIKAWCANKIRSKGGFTREVALKKGSFSGEKVMKKVSLELDSGDILGAINYSPNMDFVERKMR